MKHNKTDKKYISYPVFQINPSNYFKFQYYTPKFLNYTSCNHNVKIIQESIGNKIKEANKELKRKSQTPSSQGNKETLLSL